MFVSIAFLVEAYRGTAKEFRAHYIDCIPPSQCPRPDDLAMAKSANQYSMLNNHSLNPTALSSTSYNHTSAALLLSPLAMVFNDSGNGSASAANATAVNKAVCKPEVAILYLLLLACTFWICSSMLNFTRTPFLTETKRELIHDFALPSAVLVMSFVGSFLFKKVELTPYKVDTDTFKWKIADFHKLNWTHILVAMGLSFPLSLLFFLEQNIASVIVNSPSNKLKKGTSYHWDLFVLGVINVLLSLFGLPWVHGAL
ncbi:unnamed protein product, partial [Hymenolepis diminuta]